MAKDRKKLLHIHSSVNDKQPTPASLELGELAVNNAKNNAFISTKNSDGEVVRFSEDGTLVDWMELKEVFPYQGYVRGADDTTSGVTESDLLENKSNIILKINQVAARNSVYSDKINGALDIYGNQVNPQEPYDYSDGAGIAIDMSNYAMIGANPSFSSVTTTDKAEFNGSSFNADVTNACVQASNILTLGGANETNVGFSCDYSHSDTTNIGGGMVGIGAFSGASLVTENGDVSIKSINDNVLINANNADIVENADLIRNNARIAVTSASSAVEIISDDNIDINATGILNIHSSDNICTEAQGEAYFYGGSKTYIGVGCDGESSADEIVYKRIPKAGACEIQADTIDGALDEVLERDKIHFSTSTSEGSSTYQIWQDSGDCGERLEFTVESTVVHMSQSPNPEGATGETLITYDLWQTIGGINYEIGQINIPKDHLIEDVAVVYGVVTTSQKGEQEFTPCDSAPSGSVCHWYIRMKWYVWDGSHTDKITYLPADDFVHDIKANNDDINRGVRVDVQYNSESGVNEVSADTTLKFSTPSDVNDFTYRKYDGEHYISGTTLNFESGAFAASKYKPWSASTTVNIPTCASHIGRAKLNIEYGVNVTGKTDGAYDPGDRCDNNASATVSIPTCVSHLNRHNITFQSGSTAAFNNQTYDPGKDCANSAETINIPTCVSHLNRHNITFQAGATSAFTSQTYDAGKDCANSAETINIPTSVEHLNRKTLKLTHNGLVNVEYDPAIGDDWKLPHSALTATYEATSGKSGSVTFDTSEAKSISIPTNVSHLNRGKLTLTSGQVSDWNNATYDPSEDLSVNIPTSVSHLNRGKLEITHNNDTVVYDPGSPDTNSTLHHSALTWTYEATSGKSGSDSFDTKEEKSISIPTSVGHLSRGKLTLSGGTVPDNWDSTIYDPSEDTTVYIPTSMQHLGEFNGTCYLLDNDICMSSNTIVAQGFYSKSDRNLKENIASLSMIDASKADNVYFKSFNFKDDETKKKTYGVIAQDVLESGLDEIVHKDGDGTYNVDYISLLILKIASLTDKVEKLSDEIKELKEKHNQ